MNFLLQLFIYVVLAVASSILQSAQAQQDKNAPGVRGSRQVGGNNSLAFVVGKTGVAGQFEYGGDWGEDGGTPNAYHSEVYSLGDVPCHAMPGFFYNGSVGTLLTGEAHAELGIPVAEARVNGKDHLWVKFYDGRQTTADAMLVARLGSVPDRPYTSDMVFRGVPYAVVTALVNRELFTGFPTYMFEVEGISLYDPRLDSTAGGVGAHRLNNQTTWTYSDNPMVAAYNVLLGIRYDGEWLYGGQKTTQYQLPFSWWAAAMNKCDVLRDGTSERRFRCGYEVICAELEPQAFLGEMLLACAGRITEIGGLYKVLVADPEEPVKSFTDGDIIITDDQELDPFPGLEVTCNVISSTYPERAEAYGMKEAPTRYSSALEEADDGRRLPKPITYNAVPHALQVQDLDRIAVEDARRFRTHINTMPPEWWELEPLDVEAWTSARGGYVSKRFLITAMDDLPNGNQLVARREIDPGDYSWSSDYALPWDVAPLGIARPAPQLMTGWTAIPAVLTDAASQARRPSIEVGAQPHLDDVRAIRVQVCESWGLKRVIFDGELPYDPELDTMSFVLNGTFLPDTNYEVRGIYVPFSGRVTRWSNQDLDGTEGAWLSVTTPNIKLGADDLEQITIDMLYADVQAAINAILLPTPMSIASQMQELRDDFDAFAAKVWDHTTSYDRRTTVINAELNTAKASITEDRLVVASNSEAAAMRLDVTKAEFNGSIAGVTTLVSAVASDLSAETAARTVSESVINNSIAQVDERVTTVATNLTAEANARVALGVQVGLDIAALDVSYQAVVGPSGSLTTAVTNLSASFNGFTLNGAVGFRLETTPAGASARYAIVIRVGGVDVAASYLDAVPNGLGGYKGRHVVIGEELWMLNASGAYVTSPFYVTAGVVRARNLQVESMTSFDGTSFRLGNDGSGPYLIFEN